MKFYYAQSTWPAAELGILGVPLDRTNSFLPGCRFAPAYIRIASETIESYSSWADADLERMRICDLGDLYFTQAEVVPSLAAIERRTRELTRAAAPLIFLGGEHTVTVPIVRVLRDRHPDLCVVQFDAHADLRDEYLGERLCHATAMRRVGDLIGLENVFQFGIRSLTRDERRTGRHLFLHDIDVTRARLARRIGRRPVYLTLDIDVLDCGLQPAVGTPEPGGVTYRELVGALRALPRRQLVGADLVEFNPLAAPGLAPAALAAGLVREIALLFAKPKRR